MSTSGGGMVFSLRDLATVCPLLLWLLLLSSFHLYALWPCLSTSYKSKSQRLSSSEVTKPACWRGWAYSRWGIIQTMFSVMWSVLWGPVVIHAVQGLWFPKKKGVFFLEEWRDLGEQMWLMSTTWHLSVFWLENYQLSVVVTCWIEIHSIWHYNALNFVATQKLANGFFWKNSERMWSMRWDSERARQCPDWKPLLYLGEVGIFPIPLSLSSQLSDDGVNTDNNPSLFFTLNFSIESTGLPTTSLYSETLFEVQTFLPIAE